MRKAVNQGINDDDDEAGKDNKMVERFYLVFISFLVPIRDDDENKQFENTLMVMMIAC